MLLLVISGRKKSALRNSVLEIAGVRSRPMSLLHALGSEWWINAGQRVDEGWRRNSAALWTEPGLLDTLIILQTADKIQLTHSAAETGEDNESADVNRNRGSLRNRA